VQGQRPVPGFAVETLLKIALQNSQDILGTPRAHGRDVEGQKAFGVVCDVARVHLVAQAVELEGEERIHCGSHAVPFSSHQMKLKYFFKFCFSHFQLKERF